MNRSDRNFSTKYLNLSGLDCRSAYDFGLTQMSLAVLYQPTTAL